MRTKDNNETISRHKTERAVENELNNRNVEYSTGDDECIIQNVAFNKRRIYKADFLIKHGNAKLYVEVKGQMTYDAVNRLKYLIDKEDIYLYILQLTEIDWGEAYSKPKYRRKIDKYEKDWNMQINELKSFYLGNKTASELQELSRKRLDKWLRLRAKDVKKWKNM